MPESAILIGLQASGKTTFYRRHLAGHVHAGRVDAVRPSGCTASPSGSPPSWPCRWAYG